MLRLVVTPQTTNRIRWAGDVFRTGRAGRAVLPKEESITVVNARKNVKDIESSQI